MPTLQFRLATLAAVLMALGIVGCRRAAPPAPGADAPVAVASSYLEAAMHDLVGPDVPLVGMTSPTMCPGHFDVRPGQIAELARCRLLVRFDFQAGLDQRLSDRAAGSSRVLSITLPGGMCVPETYLAACRQIADHLASSGDLDRRKADRRLREIGTRLAALRGSLRGEVDAAGLRGTNVLCSGHQEAFCRWLGLAPVATISGSDVAVAAEIEQAATAGFAAKVRLIIANEPEGRKLADALADRLGAKVVVFANLPADGSATAFDELLRRNVDALLASATAGAAEAKP